MKIAFLDGCTSIPVIYTGQVFFHQVASRASVFSMQVNVYGIFQSCDVGEIMWVSIDQLICIEVLTETLKDDIIEDAGIDVLRKNSSSADNSLVTARKRNITLHVI